MKSSDNQDVRHSGREKWSRAPLEVLLVHLVKNDRHRASEFDSSRSSDEQHLIAQGKMDQLDMFA